MPGATVADEFDKTLAFLEAVVNADDKTTIGEIRSFADDLDAVRFNRNKINRQLSKLDLASPALEPEVIWLGASPLTASKSGRFSCNHSQ
ncbi:hypothetical protein GUO98_004723 [Salmonella enterica]|nr:hypothetical protein [Salmonella enterica]